MKNIRIEHKNGQQAIVLHERLFTEDELCYLIFRNGGYKIDETTELLVFKRRLDLLNEQKALIEGQLISEIDRRKSSESTNKALRKAIDALNGDNAVIANRLREQKAECNRLEKQWSRCVKTILRLRKKIKGAEK